MEGVPDAFTPKSVAQCLVILHENIPFTNDKDNFEGFQLADQLWVLKVWDILTGHVIIDILIAVAFEKVLKMFERDAEVETAAEGNSLMEESRIFKCEVECMPRAEATARGNDGRMGILFLYQVEDFGQNIVFVLEMSQDSFSGGDGL